MSRVSTSGFASWIGTLLACLATTAHAHEVPPSMMLLDIATNRIHIELQLPLSELGAALSQSLIEQPLTEQRLTGQPRQALAQHDPMLRDYLLAHLHLSTAAAGNVAALPYEVALQSLSPMKTDNSNWSSNDWLVAQLQATAPAGHTTENFVIDYDGIVHQVATHNILVSVRHDFRSAVVGETPRMLGLLGFQQTHLLVSSSGSWWRGFTAVLAMGVQHIAEGIDHLLFLLVLLLPAPLSAVSGRWRQTDGVRAGVLRIVRPSAASPSVIQSPWRWLRSA